MQFQDCTKTYISSLQTGGKEAVTILWKYILYHFACLVGRAVYLVYIQTYTIYNCETHNKQAISIDRIINVVQTNIFTFLTV